MKHQLKTPSTQAESLPHPLRGTVCSTNKTVKQSTSFARTLSAVLFALLMLGTLSVHPAAAQITYVYTTPLYQPGTQLNSNLGLGVHVASAQNFQEAAADGFTWIRIGMVWQTGEPTTKGQYDWTVVNQVCAWCKQYHLKPEWLIIYGNSLYGTQCSSDGITAFANFAKAGVAESIAQGFPATRYEIWNEPENFDWAGNLYSYLGPGTADPAILTNLQVAQINNAAVTAIHAADPKALVCTSAYGSLNTESYPGAAAFNQGLDSNGAFNAVGLHTYSLGQFYKSTEGKNGNDNPECMMAYNPANLSADLFQQVTLSTIPYYVPGMKTYWSTESGRQLNGDCGGDPDYFAYEWDRNTLCQWMAGFQWQALYDLDSDGEWNLQGTKAETAMKYLLTKTNGRSIAGMSFPSFSATLPPANAIWSLTLSGSPAVQIVWVPEGSASVPVPAGWVATDMYGSSLSSQVVSGALPMQESTGVVFLTNAITESSALKLSPSNLALDNLAANATVTATCTLKNTSATSVTLTPDVAARDPSGNNCDFGSNVGTTTLAPGQTLALSAGRTFTSASPAGNYSVFMAYSVNGTYYNLAPTLTLTVKPNSVAESSTLKLSPSSITLSGASPTATVTTTCTLKNTSATSVTLTPDVAARDPSGNNYDFGSNVGTTTLAPGQTLALSAGRTFDSSAPAGNYAVFMAYSVNGTYYNLTPTLTLVVKKSP